MTVRLVNRLASRHSTVLHRFAESFQPPSPPSGSPHLRSFPVNMHTLAFVHASVSPDLVYGAQVLQLQSTPHGTGYGTG
jgi:hypothetical protein